MVNTPETAREAAVYLLDKGVDLLKAYNNLTEPMVRAISEEAHKRGKHVASHVSGAADLQMRLRAGIDSVEHLGNGRSGADGNIYRPEILALLASSGVPVVPTLNVGLVYEETEGFPERIEDPGAFPFFPADLQTLIRARYGTSVICDISTRSVPRMEICRGCFVNFSTLVCES